MLRRWWPLAFALLVLPVPSFADPVGFSFEGINPHTGKKLSARADFMSSSEGSADAKLIVVLTNTAKSNPFAPNDILTAVFFKLNATLSPYSAKLGPTSKVIQDSQPAGGNVGGEWAHKSAIVVGFDPMVNQIISSTGLDLIGPDDRFPGPDLDPPDSPNGVNYGITTKKDTISNDNAGLRDEPRIKNQVIFKLSGFGALNPLTAISNVYFQYGTDLNEPRFYGTPEPASLTLFCLGGLTLAGRQWWRRRGATTVS